MQEIGEVDDSVSVGMLFRCKKEPAIVKLKTDAKREVIRDGSSDVAYQIRGAGR